MQSFCGTRIISGDSVLQIAPDVSSLLALEIGGTKRFELKSAILDGFDERGAIADKCRIHRADDGLSGAVELNRTLPFGGEFKLTRRMECTGRFARISDDFAPGGAALRKLELEEAVWHGPWSKIYATVLRDGKLAALEFIPGDAETVFLDGGELIVAVCAVSPDGAMVEIGCGNDLWRHDAASGLADSHAIFRLCGTARQLTLTRRIFEFSEAAAVQMRPWRFKYYVAWYGGEALPELPETVFKLNDAALGSHCFTTGNTPCWAAAPVRRLLRETVRKSAGSLTVKSGAPACCHDAGHLERAGKSELLHYGAEDLMELYLWGNRTLSKRGERLAIDIPGDGALAAGLRMPPLKQSPL